MYGEFTNYCSHYYRLTTDLETQQQQLNQLLDNAPVYSGQKRLTEIDAIIAYYREAQAAKAQADKTIDEMRKTERVILQIMQHFEIPAGVGLTGEIPGEVQYQVWVDDVDTVRIRKINDLVPEELGGNIMVLEILMGRA